MTFRALWKISRVLIMCSLVVVLSGASKCNWFKPKIQLPDVRVTFGDPVTLILPLKDLEITVGIRIPIPDLEGAFVELTPQIGANPSTLVLSVPAKAFDNPAFRLRDPATLPGGRPLPKIGDGKLPAVGLEVPQWKHIVFYLGLEVAAVFVPTQGKDPDVQITLPITDPNGKDIGFISRIPQDNNGQNGGYFVSFFWELATSLPPGQFGTIRPDGLTRVELEGIPYDLRDVFEVPAQ